MTNRYEKLWFLFAFVGYLLMAYFAIHGINRTDYGNTNEYDIRDCGRWCK
jgi:hypothetical protein